MKKLQKIVFILLLIFLPSQFGLHFWPSWAYINGIRVDYFSPTLYFTDFFVLTLVILEGAKRPIGSFWKMLSLRSSMTLFFIVLFVLLNIYFSYSPFVSIYKWLKVAEFGFLAWFIAKNAHHSIKLEQVSVMLLVPIFYESVLAIWQFLSQSSIGGLWYFLGERTFNSSTPGIANAVINGQMVLRPYGTFPHPNVLTGFLIVGGLLVLKILPALGPQRSEDRKVPAKQGSYFPHNYRIITALVLILVIMVLFLTPSRGNLLNGLNIRQQFNNVAVNQWLTAPVFGTGLGTSPLYTTGVKNYALVHQPTHNIYLMLLAETGILGFGVFLFLIKKRFSTLLLPVLFIGIFDHYWLTLQQGQLLLVLALGLSSIIKKT